MNQDIKTIDDLLRENGQLKRELEIESSLERVRTVAMSMMKSDELLKVCESVFRELRLLGFTEDDLRNAQIIINNDDKRIYSAYQYSDYIGGEIAEVPYDLHPVIHLLNDKLRLAKDAFADIEISGASLENWKEFVNSFPQKHDEKLNAATELHYYFYSVGIGALGISSFKSLSEEKLKILQRLRNVFNLSYKRYTDIALAEAQAKEAKIELALERVRARAMSMQHSDELAELVGTLFKELTQLDFSLTSCIIWMHDHEHTNDILWISSAEMNKPAQPFRVQPFYDAFFKSIIHAWKAKDPKWVYALNGNEKKTFEKAFFKELPNLPDALRKALKVPKQVVFSASFNNFGALEIVETEPLTDEKFDILHRFGKVFDSSYTRFNDLKKAEAQSREAKIELGLERVRARAMAMQNSAELAELVTTVFNELIQLDFALAGCIIWIHDQDQSKNTLWITSAEMNKPAEPFQVQPFYIPFFKSIIHAWKAKDSKWIYTFNGSEKKIFEKAFFKELPNLPDTLRIALQEPEQVVFSASYNNFGALQIVETEPLTDEKFDILHRFGKVFNSSYTRFNDLEKAEAQAREAKIEAALEKVRSRTMAMQHSDHLSETAFVLFKQFQELGEAPERIFIATYNEEDNNVIDLWGTNEGGNKLDKLFKVLVSEPTVISKINTAWKEKKKSVIIDLSGNELNEYLHFLKSTGMPVTEGVISNRRVQTVACFSKGVIGVTTPEPQSIESVKLLERFAGVFEQIYTRFLDLQKAEAQAREAQIETAMERVRNRTMGMQRSEELKEVIQVVYDQFVHLNIKIEHTGFVIDYKARDDYDIWIADPLGVPSRVIVPYFDSVYYNRFNEAKKKGEDFFATNLSFEEKNRFYEKLFEYVPGLPEESKKFYFSCPGLAASTVLLENVCLYIENFSGTPYSDEENNTLMRFGKVFQQTYTRFLDLQKAEAQAREAKIEAALERTRTQSMIMQHSKELDNTLRVFHEQVLLLGIHSAFSFLWLPDEDKDRHIFWAAWGENKNGSTVFNSKAINYPLDRNEPATAQCLVDWKGKQPVVSYHVPPAGVENYFAAWQELIAGVEQLKPEYFSDGLYYVEAFMKYGCFGVMIKNDLPEEEKKILGRFAIEFERAYTRFLDLQKAEAQAREAKIETALEKVRSRTMAMQNSNELPEAANLLFQQMQDLGMPAWSAGYCIWDDDKSAATFWMSSAGIIQKPFRAPTTEDPSFIHFYEAWKRGETFYVEEMGGDELASHYQYMCRLPVVGEMLNKFVDEGGSLPAFQIYHLAFFSQGFLLFITYEPVPEAHDIFKRFGKVFDQTYTRFLDLKKAETQAKESELEKKRSEDLLLNILPREIANELKQFGKSYARKHEQVSILFTDIKGFSTISETLSAEELVNQLDECFRAFDHIVGKHGLEKIKTIGDAYICACGLPNPDPDNAVKTVRAAIDMLDFAKGFGMTKIIQDLPAFEFRVGIHTGPVITGVVGLKKFTYDIWGDAVNMAARMEQHGEAGRINVSGNTYQLIKDKFICTHRGKILAKNKGEVDMYFVEKANN